MNSNRPQTPERSSQLGRSNSNSPAPSSPSARRAYNKSRITRLFKKIARRGQHISASPTSTIQRPPQQKKTNLGATPEEPITISDDDSSSDPEDLPTSPPRPSPPSRKAKSSPAALGTSPRSPKSPKLPQNPVARDIDDAIFKTITKPGKLSTKAKKRIGFNYVLNVDSDHPGPMLKLGIAQNVAQRIKNILATCEIELSQVKGPDQWHVENHHIAERLIHIELRSYRQTFTCRCPTNHREYFKIDHEIALEITRRWSAFCAARPWNTDGTLRGFWKERLENRQQCTHDEEIHDHDKRAARWHAFAHPTRMEYFAYYRTHLSAILMPQSWHVISTLYSIYVCYATGAAWWAIISALVYMYFNYSLVKEIYILMSGVTKVQPPTPEMKKKSHDQIFNSDPIALSYD